MYILTYEIGRGGDKTSSIATFDTREQLEAALQFIASKYDDVDFEEDYYGGRMVAGEGQFVVINTLEDPHNPTNEELMASLDFEGILSNDDDDDEELREDRGGPSFRPED